MSDRNLACKLCLDRADTTEYSELPEDWEVRTLTKNEGDHKALYQLVSCPKHSTDEVIEKKKKIESHWNKIREKSESDLEEMKLGEFA